MKCRDCENLKWSYDEGERIWQCRERYCPDLNIERDCPYFSIKEPDIFTTLSMLQAENEKLRAELEQAKREHGMFQPVLNGKNAREKQAILARLRGYRKARGLGCLEEVAREAGTGFTEDLLRGLLTGDSSISIPQWRKLNKALDNLEHSGEVSGE